MTTLGNYRQDLAISAKVAPPGTPLLDALLWHVNVVPASRISDEIMTASEEGMAVDLEEGGPLFPEIKVAFLSIPGALGSLCAEVNKAIFDHFEQYQLPMPRDLRSVITTGAMIAGNFDQALGYLLRWVGIDFGEED